MPSAIYRAPAFKPDASTGQPASPREGASFKSTRNFVILIRFSLLVKEAWLGPTRWSACLICTRRAWIS